MMEGMKRPEAIVLPDSALIPSNCLISPPPNQFTHEVTRSQAFYASHGTPSGPPTGQFDAGTKVVLLYYDGKSFAVSSMQPATTSTRSSKVCASCRCDEGFSMGSLLTPPCGGAAPRSRPRHVRKT
jgi:hypothetical protein